MQGKYQEEKLQLKEKEEVKEYGDGPFKAVEFAKGPCKTEKFQA